VIEEEEEEPRRRMIEEEEEEPSKAERKQIEDDGGAGNAPDDLCLMWIAIAIAFLLVITWAGWVAWLVLVGAPSTRPTGEQVSAIGGKEGRAEVTKTGPADKTQMRRRFQTRPPGRLQDATAIGGKEGRAQVRKTVSVEDRQRRRISQTKAPVGSQDATAVRGKERTAEATKATKTAPADKIQRRRKSRTHVRRSEG
jgi:hypothetical protein